MSISTKRTARSIVVLVFCCLFAGSVALGSSSDGGGGEGGNGGGGNGGNGGGGEGGNGGGGEGGNGGGGEGGNGGGGNSGGNSVGGGGGSSGGGGSGSSSGGGGEGGRHDGGPPIYVSKKTYDMGKKVFFEHVVCDTCIYAELELTPESVGTTWRAIKKDLRRSGEIGSDLERRERRSVKLFIRKRFGL